ncbi:hypothetical protein Tco_1435651 [Tanacetum coccineum]
MYGFKECSSCGALYNREHCCSNVSSIDNFVRDPNLISYDETPDSSQQPPHNCSKCGDYINTPNWNYPALYDNDDEDNDEEYTIAITPVLPTMEPDNSLSMGDEHLSTIPEKKESKVEDMSPITNDDESFENIDYVEASLLDSELVSLEEVKDDILREKLLNINLLIAKIETLKDNPTPSIDSILRSPSSFPNSFLEETDTSDNSLPESEIFCFDVEEKSSGNPTLHFDLSLPDYEAFYYDNEPD